MAQLTAHGEAWSQLSRAMGERGLYYMHHRASPAPRGSVPISTSPSGGAGTLPDVAGGRIPGASISDLLALAGPSPSGSAGS